MRILRHHLLMLHSLPFCPPELLPMDFLYKNVLKCAWCADKAPPDKTPTSFRLAMTTPDKIPPKIDEGGQKPTQELTRADDCLLDLMIRMPPKMRGCYDSLN